LTDSDKLILLLIIITLAIITVYLGIRKNLREKVAQRSSFQSSQEFSPPPQYQQRPNQQTQYQRSPQTGIGMKCPNCGAGNLDDALFCAYCAKPIALTQLSASQSQVESQNKCPHCGTDNPAGLKYCVKCGESILSSTSDQELEKSIPDVPDEDQPIEDLPPEAYQQQPKRGRVAKKP